MTGKQEKWLYFFNILLSRWVNSGKNIEAANPANILCIKWDEIGDMATCTHVFSLLKKRFPEAEIHVITKEHSAGLIKNDPNIHRVFTSIDDWNKKYDIVVELRGTWKSFFKTFRYYPKFRLDRGLIRMRHKGHQLHETLTNFEVIEPLLNGLEYEKPKLYPGEGSRTRIGDWIREQELDRFAVFHVGARRELRRWNAAGFAETATYLYKKYQLIPVFTGTGDEETQVREVTTKLDIPYKLFLHDFELADLIALLEKATIFVGNESGPLQMADAMNLPLVGLFGPGVVNVFYPRGERADFVHHVLDCNPCDQIHCVRPENPCIDLITAAEVKAKIDKVLRD